MSFIKKSKSNGSCQSSTENTLGYFHKYMKIRHEEMVSHLLADDQLEVFNGLLLLPKSTEIDVITGSVSFMKGGKVLLKIEKEEELPFEIEYLGLADSGARMYALGSMK
jgi:hypothetical protein